MGVVNYDDFINLKNKLQTEFNRRKYNGAINTTTINYPSGIEEPKENDIASIHHIKIIDENFKIVNSNKGLSIDENQEISENDLIIADAHITTLNAQTVTNTVSDCSGNCTGMCTIL